MKILNIQDQARLVSLPFSEDLEALEILSFDTCKTLTRLERVRTLPRLRALRACMTALDFEDLWDQGLPQSLRKVAFYTGKTKANDEVRGKIEQKGYEFADNYSADSTTANLFRQYYGHGVY